MTCVMWWGHTLVWRNTWSPLVLLNALLPHTIYQEVWRADKSDLLWQEVSGVNLCPHPSILICYPLSFIHKVEHSHHLYKAFLPVEEHTSPALKLRFSLLHYAMTFRSAGLSRDPHGIGWKDSLPFVNHFREFLSLRAFYVKRRLLIRSQTA